MVRPDDSLQGGVGQEPLDGDLLVPVTVPKSRRYGASRFDLQHSR